MSVYVVFVACWQRARMATTGRRVSSCATVSTPGVRVTRSLELAAATLDTGDHAATEVSESL